MNSLTEVLMKLHSGVYMKMSTEIPTKVELHFCVKWPPVDTHEDFQRRAHGKSDGAHENVPWTDDLLERELGQIGEFSSELCQVLSPPILSHYMTLYFSELRTSDVM